MYSIAYDLAVLISISYIPFDEVAGLVGAADTVKQPIRNVSLGQLSSCSMNCIFKNIEFVGAWKQTFFCALVQIR